MTEVVVSTEIAAPADEVWRVLTDLAGYRRWNPFIRRAWGSLAAGGTVHVHVRGPRRLPLAFRAVVEVNDAGRLLRWRGSFIRTWLGTGVHDFVVEPLAPGRARLTQRERFTGVLPRLVSRRLADVVVRGFEAMNRALAAEAEGATRGAEASRARA